MQMKYFQGVADIHNYYHEILWTMDIDGIDKRYLDVMLKVREVQEGEMSDFMEEYEAITYLVCCRLEMAYKEVGNLRKPSVEVMNRCLNRYLKYIDKVHHCRADNYRQHVSKHMRNSYLAARHYLFKFSLPAWYAKLPDEILTYENKWRKK